MSAFLSSRRQLAAAVDRREQLRQEIGRIRRKPVAAQDSRRIASLSRETQLLDDHIGDLTKRVARQDLADRLELMRLGWEFPAGPQTFRGSPDFQEPLLRKGREASWALTLTLGVTPTGPFDPEVSFKPELAKLLKDMATEVFALPRRASKRLTAETAPHFLGVYESHDKHGRPWPHIHGAIALGRHSEELMRGFLRDKWGEDEHPDRPAVVARDLIAVPIKSQRPAPRSVVRRRGYRPSFALVPIRDRQWFGDYVIKSSTTSEISIWTTADILNLTN